MIRNAPGAEFDLYQATRADCSWFQQFKRDLGMSCNFLISNASTSLPEAIDECMKAGSDSLKWPVNAEREKQFETIMGVSRKLFRRFAPRISAWTRPARSARNASGTSNRVPVRPGLIWINIAAPAGSKLIAMQRHSTGTDIRV